MSSEASGQPQRDDADRGIAVVGFSATRLATGSKFSEGSIPPELSTHDFFYENPRFGLKVGFEALWIREALEAERDGNPRSIEAFTGVILLSGQLASSLAVALGTRATEALISELLRDCHELMCEYLLRRVTKIFTVSFTPRIYEAESCRLYTHLNSGRLDVSPSVLSESGAQQVFSF